MMLKLSIAGLAIDRMGSGLWKDWERCVEREGQERAQIVFRSAKVVGIG